MSFKIEQRDGVEIYASEGGFVVLNQMDGLGNEATVFIHPDDISQVIDYLSKVKAIAYQIRAQDTFQVA